LIPDPIVCCAGAAPHIKEKKDKEDSAGSDDTVSMIKGGGYFGARTRQPPTVQIIKIKINVGQGGCVP
jgi:hypothetical protein